jgi:hypothetical protein
MARITFICPTCKGRNVKRDAWAARDEQNQLWELAGEPFDNAWCDDCGGAQSHLEQANLEIEPAPVA